MSILKKISSALDRKDEIPNQALAQKIVADADSASIKELIINLKNSKKAIQQDCIKVLYEIGNSNPTLISEYVDEFMTLLTSKNNRLQWGGMTALDKIVLEVPQRIFPLLPDILAAADKGSVITKDGAVGILIKFCTMDEYAESAFTLLIEQLIKAPSNQLPMYAERTIPVITDQNKEKFIETLTPRLSDIEKESKRKRIEKVIRKINQ